MEKTMKARVQHKHDIEANWLKATNFTPLASEIIVYDPDENYDYPRIKIGDGKTNINALPFVTKDYAKISDIPTKPQDIGALPDSTVIPTVPTKISAFENDKGYLTQHQSLDAYAKTADLGALATKDSLTASDVGALPDTTKIPGALSDLSEDTTHRVVTDAEKEAWNAKSNFSGSYNDLTNKPTIPSVEGLASTTYVDNAVKNKVDKDGNKVLSTNDYTTAEKNKLAGIAAGAEVNVNADWNATSGDAQILNKPTLGSMAAKSSVAKGDLVSGVQTSLGKADTALQPTDISDWAKQPNKPEYGADEIILDTSGWNSSESSDDGSRLKLDDFLESLRQEVNSNRSDFSSHAIGKSNPHSVTKTQVGLGNVDNVKQYSASNQPPYPVTSVNNKTGAVSLSASDVGALPSNTKIPAKTSDLINDSGFITGYTETDPTVPAWAKAATKPSYTKTEVGLGNVDNTSDANKPVSTKQATAIADAKKAGTDAQANLDTHTNNFSNPHFVTKSQIGLDYVENVRQYSANNPPILAQPTPPDDPNALWVDTSDDGDDGFQEAVKTAVAQAKGEIVQEVIAALPIYTGEVL